VLETKDEIIFDIFTIPSCIIQGLDRNEVYDAILTKENCSLIISIITKNILDILVSITDFMDLFDSNFRNKIFLEFIDLCNQNNIVNHYQITSVFKNCQKKMEDFIVNIDSINHLTKINEYTVQYITKYKKIPLYMQIYMQK
jgi:hypothetical protein